MVRARRRTLLLVGLIAVAALVLLGAGTLLRTAPAATFVAEKPCPDSEFSCVTLRVPRDHFGTGRGTVEVTFGILRASSRPRKGVFVTATGGPGTSGLAAADSYTEAFDPRIREDYDIVFFDQRGIGRSEPLQCPDAALAFYTTDALPTRSAAEASAFAEASQSFAKDCVKEAGADPADLPYFSTRQAVEDLEAFRAWLKADQIDLYGESYGTQFAQTYAAAHPGRVHALFLDGVVDLTLSGTDYYAESAKAYEEALRLTLDRCAGAPGCQADAGGADLLHLYDTLVTQLGSAPVSYRFVNAHGNVMERPFTLGDLENAASGDVASTTDRMLLQRAMASAAQGDYLALARLAFAAVGQDPETLGAVIDPTWSDAMYYAVECQDYAYGSAEAFLQAGVAAKVDTVRLGSIFYGDLPCSYWPSAATSPARPGYLTDTPFPVFVLNSSVDPATPFAGAMRVHDHLSDAYLIVQPGGPHVIFGRGVACIDDPVTAFLVDGALPPRTTTCDFLGTDDYVPIPATSVDQYDSTLDALGAVDDELNYNADYWNWVGTDPLAFGCAQGGWVEYEASDAGYAVNLHDCAFSAGLPLSGRASINDDGSFSLSATSGAEPLTYDRDADGNREATGDLPS